MGDDTLEIVRGSARPAGLRRLGLLDTPAVLAFDRLTRLAAKLLRAPIALVSLVDQDHQPLKSFVGLGELWASRCETPLPLSLCQYVVESGEPLIVQDASADPRVRDNLALPELGTRAYAGIPLITRDGDTLGSFCAIDTVPRAWTAGEIDSLRDLAASVVTEIELRGDIAERKRAEEALRESEVRFQGIFASAPLGIALADLAGCILESNAAFQSMLHYSAEELRGRPFGAITYPDDITRDWELAAELIAGKRDQYRMEKRYYRKDGQVVWANLTVSLIRGAAGDPQFAIGMVEDITERKHAEQALADREAMLRALGDNLPNSMIYQVIQEAEDRLQFTYLSRGVVRSTGAQPEQIYADPALLFDRIVEEDRARYWAAEAASFREPSIFDIEVRSRIPSGEIIWQRICSQPRRLADGRLIWDGFSIDVTEHKRTETALRESEERFRTLIRDLSVGVLLQGPNAEILLCNQAAIHLLGMDESQLLGKKVFDSTWRVIHEDGTPFPIDTQPAPQAIATRRPVRNVTMGVYRPKARDHIWLLVSAEPQLGDDGAVRQVICTLHDITERQRAEQEREQLIEALKEALVGIKILRGLLPICVSCKKIRDDSGYWNQIETYIHAHSEADFTHSVCPDCAHKLYPDLFGD